MILLVVGVLAFASIHIISAIPRLEDYWHARLGASYRPVFGLLLLLSLTLVVLGWRSSPLVPVYDPPTWGRYVTFVLVLLAFFCLGIFLFRGSLRQKLRFPLALGVILWGIGHLFANGDLASLILFGGMILYAVAHIALGVANGLRPSTVMRPGHDPLSLLAGAALYGVMTQLHPVLIGVPILDLGSMTGTG
jgi:uncharacterized membrane protein